jgi:N-acetylglucosamine kinase-like BadF-type ATPase
MTHGTSPIVVGVDAGGTKTEALACDRDGRVLGFARAGKGNWETIGLDAAGKAFSEAVGGCLDAAGVGRRDVAASAFALAGLDWASDRAHLEPVVAGLGLSGPRTVVNDAFGALRAGSRRADAVISIAGTGTVTAGRNAAGEVFRTLGVACGERGGGANLVQAALDAVADQLHRGQPAGELARRFCQETRVESVEALFEHVSRNVTNRKQLAALAPAVRAAAQGGDRIAIGVLRATGRCLARTTCIVADRLGLAAPGFDVVCAGSVHTAMVELSRAFDKSVHRRCPDARIRRLEAPPVVGAALLALDSLGSVTDDVTARLMEQATLAARRSREDSAR